MGTLIITYHRGIAPRKQKQQTFINEQKTRAIQDLDLVGSQPEDAQGNQWHATKGAKQTKSTVDQLKLCLEDSSEHGQCDVHQVEQVAKHQKRYDPEHDMSESDLGR